MSESHKPSAMSRRISIVAAAIVFSLVFVLEKFDVKARGWICFAAWVAPVTALIVWQLWRVRAALGLWLRGMAGGPKPVWAKVDASGRTRGKCPACGAEVVFSKIAPDQLAFECEKCGNTAHWSGRTETAHDTVITTAGSSIDGKTTGLVAAQEHVSMSPTHTNNFPKLHNAAWPGVVGKGPDSEPPIELDTMLDLTAAAEVNGVKFDGVDLFLFAPHVDIDSSDDDLKTLADKVRSRKLVIGSVVAPVWAPTGGGSAMGSEQERASFLTQVRKGCQIAKKLREMGVRPHGVVRIDSSVDPGTWSQGDATANSKKIAGTFREAAVIAEDHGERLAAEGEICWGGMHSWKRMVQLLEMTDRPKTVGFQADMAHTLLYLLGYNAPEDRILPANFDWQDTPTLQDGLKKLTAALRPWTIDFHVAQNDGTVKGSGSHDKTGRHCLPDDPNGRLNIARDAGHWLRDEKGALTKKIQHICWDGCMFPNDVMHKPGTWNSILAAMIAVRDAHGWKE
jgi:sugar phosphate isomerase/epimerase